MNLEQLSPFYDWNAFDAHQAFRAECMREQGLDPSSETDCNLFLSQQDAEWENRDAFADVDSCVDQQWLPYAER